MFKALIADDENKVCQLICTLGNWEQLGIEVVAVCNDGETALEEILRLRPDIVLTDIRMPMYDGLKLIEKSKEAGIDAAFIIISGYRQFEYAHSAIKFGIMDYLLKPIDASQLNDVLAKTCDNLCGRRQKQESDKAALRIIEENRDKLRAKFMEQLRLGKMLLSDTAEIEKQYQVHLSGELFQVLLLNTCLVDLHSPDTLFAEKVAQIVKHLFAFCSDAVCAADTAGVWVMLNYGDSNVSEIKACIKTFYSNIRMLEEIYGDFHPVMGVSSVKLGLSKLPQLFSEAMLAERAKLFSTSPEVLYFDYLPAQKTAPLSDEQLRQLYSAMEALNRLDVEHWFISVTHQLELQGASGVEEAFLLRDQVSEQIFRFMQQAGYENAEARLGQLMLATDRVPTCFALCKLLSQCALEMIDSLMENRNNRENRPILLAKQYIVKHYGEQISLEDVASFVGFTPTYFSSIFKTHVGKNFTDYLTDVRIDAAKEMLRTSNRNVSDIAAAVGYSDDKYFRKLFKRMVGTKPSEFRWLYSSKSLSTKGK